MTLPVAAPPTMTQPPSTAAFSRRANEAHTASNSNPMSASQIALGETPGPPAPVETPGTLQTVPRPSTAPVSPPASVTAADLLRLSPNSFQRYYEIQNDRKAMLLIQQGMLKTTVDGVSKNVDGCNENVRQMESNRHSMIMAQYAIWTQFANGHDKNIQSVLEGRDRPYQNVSRDVQRIQSELLAQFDRIQVIGDALLQRLKEYVHILPGKSFCKSIAFRRHRAYRLGASICNKMALVEMIRYLLTILWLCTLLLISFSVGNMNLFPFMQSQ